MKSKIFVLGVAFSYSLIMASCSSDTASEKQEDANFEYTQEEEQASNEEESTYFLPSALQIGSVFQKSGLRYADGIVNSPSNVTKYESKSSKLLNFGVYSADLAFCVLNSQSQIAMNQLKVLRTLASGIGMESIFESENLFSKFEKNMGNQDSVIDVMVSIQERTDMFIDDNNLQSMANVIFAGAWIEGMYIGVKSTSNETEKKITARLLEQMVILDNLIKALEDVDTKTPDIEKLHTDLKDLSAFYSNLQSIKGKEKVNFKEIEVPVEDLKQIADKIVAMRTSIVNPS